MTYEHVNPDNMNEIRELYKKVMKKDFDHDIKMPDYAEKWTTFLNKLQIPVTINDIPKTKIGISMSGMTGVMSSESPFLEVTNNEELTEWLVLYKMA